MSIVPVKINSVQPQITYGDVNYNNSYITDMKEDIEDLMDAVEGGIGGSSIPDPLEIQQLKYSNKIESTTNTSLISCPYIRLQNIGSSSYINMNVDGFGMVQNNGGNASTTFSVQRTSGNVKCAELICSSFKTQTSDNTVKVQINGSTGDITTPGSIDCLHISADDLECVSISIVGDVTSEGDIVCNAVECNSIASNNITYLNPPNDLYSINGVISIGANPNAVDIALASNVLYTTNVDDVLYPNVGVDIGAGSYILDVEYRVNGASSSSVTCKVLFYEFLNNQWVSYNGTSRRTSSIINNSGIGSNDSGYANFQWILPHSFFSVPRVSTKLKIAMQFTVSTGSTTFLSQNTKYTLVRLS